MSAYLLYPSRGDVMPVDALLGAIPSLPRPLLSRLVTRMIDRMDELDGDPDLELDADDEDGNDQEKTND